MKITKISIENLGPYIGTNHIAFSVDDALRKVVLIGGKNGAGKTTLFNSIRIGLYGCRAFGFESNNAKYIELVTQLINSSALLKKEGRASVTISILMDDGKDDYQYTFERSWRLTTKNLREDIVVSRNGVTLSETEKSDFQSYLLQLIPPDMFRFYFFDGESISNFVFNGIKNTDFKNAFLKLCGLDTMEIIYDNFLRISNMRKKDVSGAYEEYQTALEEQRKLSVSIENATVEKEAIQGGLLSIEEQLAKSEQDFIQRGGISKKEYQAMQTQINKEESKRETTRRWLKDIANDVLPFIVLKDQLVALRERIIAEDEYHTSLAFRAGLESPKIHSQLIKTFDALGIDYAGDLSEKVIEVLSDAVSENDTDAILNLSKREQLDLLAKISSHLAFDTSRVSAATKAIEASLQRVKQIRKKMDKSDASGADTYFAMKDELLTQKSQKLQAMLEVERKMDSLNIERAEVEARVKRAQQKYEEFLKAKSVSDVTAKALLAFGDLQQRLYKKYINDVEQGFKDCFRSLINKSDLIDGIKIDEQLQVYPYKLKTFKRSELKRLTRQYGDNYIVSQLGSIAYEVYVSLADGAADEAITLPVEVKQQLSAGEKQIFIMALYQALSKLNKVSVPYIIDTPFARIDTEHRQNILSNFFMNLKGQIIILSTDEEIVDSYQRSIDQSVSNYYLLQHTENHGTEIMKNKYFGGECNGI